VVGKLDSLMLPISQKMMEDVGRVKILIVGFIQYIGFNFFEQLKVGGWMVVPVGEGNVQQMRKITKKQDGSMLEEYFDEFSFVPMLSGKES